MPSTNAAISAVRGLDTVKTVHTFTGKLRDNLDFNWEHCKIFKGGEDLSPDYEAREGDVILIQEYPEAAATLAVIMVVTTVVSIGAAVGGALYANYLGNKMKSDMEAMLDNMKNQRSDSSLPYVAGARNQTLEGKNPPFILGRTLFSPYFLCSPYMSVSGGDGEDMYWWGAFLVGQSGLCFEKIKNGDTVLKAFAGGAAQSGSYAFDSGALYDAASRVEIRQGTRFSDEIFNQKWIDSLSSSQQLEFSKDWKDAGNDHGKELVFQSAKHPMRLEIQFDLNGLIAYNSKGEEVSNTARIYVGYSLDGVSYTPIPISGWSYNGVYSELTRAANKQMRFIAAVDLPASVLNRAKLDVDVKAYRVNAQSSANAKDAVYISAIRTKQYNHKTSTASLVAAENIDRRLRDKFCYMGVKIKAKKEITDKLDNFNAIVSMTARTWSGSSWTAGKTKTSNAAAVALEVLTSPLHTPSRFEDAEVNLQSFGKLYEFCENQTIHYAGAAAAVKLQCNGAATAVKKKMDLLKEILSVCEAGVYTNEFGALTAYFDAPQDTPVALVNPQRLVSMSVTKDFSRKADGYKVDYVNQDNDLFAEDSFAILRNGALDDDSVQHAFAQAQFVYVTQYAHAAWLARRLQAKETLRPTATKITVGKEGGCYRVNDLIKVQHEKFKIGVGSGEVSGVVIENGEVTGVRTLERFDLLAGESYVVEYTIVNNSESRVVTKRIAGQGAYTNLLLFAQGFELPLNSPDIPDNGMIVSVTLNGAKPYLIGGDMTETADGWEIPLIEYNEAVYDTGIVPDYASDLTATQPKITADAVPVEPVTLESLNAAVNERVSYITEDGAGIAPDNVAAATARAFQDFIELSFSMGAGGLAGAIRQFHIEVSKNGGASFPMTILSNSLICRYYFDRPADGFPEKTDLAAWRFRVKAENIYGNLSPDWTPLAAVNTAGYGTWLPGAPTLSAAARENGIDVSITSSPPANFYGSVSYTIDVKLSGAARASYNTREQSSAFLFDRAFDGYPEKADFAKYAVTATAHNDVANKTGAKSANAAIDTSSYGTWTPAAAAIGGVKARRDNIEAFVSYTPPAIFYGGVDFILLLKYNGALRHKTRQPESQYIYQFDRSIDGYPEKEGYSLSGTLDKDRAALSSVPQLALYTLSAQAVNATSGKTSAVSDEASPDASEYLTWLPSAPALSGSTAGRAAEIKIDFQNFYGAAGAVYQISKAAPTPVSGWHAPLMADAATVYSSEAAWKGAAGADYYTPSGQLTQTLPLEGQSVDLPKDTTYAYRARGVTKDILGNALYYSGLSAEQTILAKGTGVRDVVANAIGAQQIMPDAVTIEKLNVLAKNIINPLTAENADDTLNADASVTPEGWTGAIRLIDDAVYGRCGRFQKSGSAAYSSCSTTIAISPEETLEFKMTPHPLHAAATSRGLAVFVSNADAVNSISWDGDNKRWSESAAANNYVFISGYKDADDFSLTTYVIGANVDLADVPAPKSSREAYPRCIRIKSGVQSVSLIFDENSANAFGWLVVRPQLHRIGDGRIVAQNILAKDLSAISANLGDVNSGLLFTSGDNKSAHSTEALANFFDLDTGEFRVGSARAGETPSGEPADPTDSNWYFHAIPGIGLFMKITNFVITALSSVIRGAFKITRKSGAGAGAALFALNPEAEAKDGEPAASMRIGAGSIPVAETHYGALSRTGKSTLNGALEVTDAADSSSAAAGALIVKGGAGVAKNLNVGGNVAITGATVISKDADSSSAATGALIVKGGVGVAKNLNVGGALAASGALADAAASTTLPGVDKADIWSRIQVLRNNAKAALLADATIAGKKTFSTPPAGVSNLAKHNDGVTAANIFAAPPLGAMGAISYHHFEANPFPAANKSPIQSGGAESWDIVTLNLERRRATQIAAQVFDVGHQGRVFIRNRHVDNDTYSQWQAWREIVKIGDKASLLAINNAAGLDNSLQYMQLSAINAAGDIPSDAWHHVLKMNHGIGDAYYNRTLALPFGSDEIYTRRREGGAWRGWRKLVLEGDSPTFANVYIGSTSYTAVKKNVADAIEGVSCVEFTGVPSNAGHGGAVDFHYNGSSADYTSRLIEDGSGQLSVYAANFNCQAPFLPRSSPVPGSVSVAGVYTPARGLYIFAFSGNSYYNTMGGPFSGSEPLALIGSEGAAITTKSVSYKKF